MGRKQHLYEVTMTYYPCQKTWSGRSPSACSFLVLADNGDEARAVATREFLGECRVTDGESAEAGRYVMDSCVLVLAGSRHENDCIAY
jgi:hypothetical protein